MYSIHHDTYVYRKWCIAIYIQSPNTYIVSTLVNDTLIFWYFLCDISWISKYIYLLSFFFPICIFFSNIFLNLYWSKISLISPLPVKPVGDYRFSLGLSVKITRNWQRKYEKSICFWIVNEAEFWRPKWPVRNPAWQYLQSSLSLCYDRIFFLVRMILSVTHVSLL